MDNRQDWIVAAQDAALRGREPLDARALALNLGAAQQLITRGYLEHLTDARLIPLGEGALHLGAERQLRLIRLTDMVYDHRENILQKVSSILGTLSFLRDVNVALYLHNAIGEAGEALEMYMGVSSPRLERLESACSMLEQAISGQFPGCERRLYTNEEASRFLERALPREEGCAISAVSVDAVLRNEEESGFVQGLEKFADSMRGRPYTLAIVATPVDRAVIDETVRTYEELYTQISPYQRVTLTQTRGTSEGTSDSDSEQLSRTLSHASTVTTGTSSTRSTGKSTSKSRERYNPEGAMLDAGMMLLGSMTPLGAYGGSVLGKALRQMGDAAPEQEGSGTQVTDAQGTMENAGETDQKGTTEGESRTHTRSEQRSQGASVQYTRENRAVTGLMEAVAAQIERLGECRGQGAFRIATYVMAGDYETANTGAGLYGALMSGSRRDSVFHVNTWHAGRDVELLREYMARARHPRMQLTGTGPFEQVDPAVFVPCREAPLYFFWPRKSLSGLTVSRHAEFARSMPVPERERSKPRVELGSVYHLGHRENNRVFLTHDSICSHLCVAGAPGSGKSNFCYQLLGQLHDQGVRFLVIEPAKGEYASVLGGLEGVRCYCASPMDGQLFSVNPFAFPPGIGATAHMEALLNLLSTCWPMYAAMSAILKDAMVRVYENAGWDMDTGLCLDEEPTYPTFADLMALLPRMIDESDYSDEVKGNYKGALLSRVQSMTNGTNRMIFCRPETGDELLFNHSAIIDLSRVGSQETLALIMGVLVMRLDEFRRSERLGTNLPLRHVTVLEEAHNLLSSSQITAPGEGASVGGKSVEMITRAIAQMRTYGEGFMIVDQTPSALSEAVNSNTSTKVIFNLPESRDREAMGRAISLSEEQMEEAAVLDRGVCILRSRGFLAPVQMLVDYYPPERQRPWVWRPQSEDLRRARGHAAELVLGLCARPDGELLAQLRGSPRQADRELCRAAERPGGGGAALLGALGARDWFRFPEAGALEAWDGEMRRALRRRALLGREAQDAVLERLLRASARGPGAEALMWRWVARFGRFRPAGERTAMERR